MRMILTHSPSRAVLAIAVMLVFGSQWVCAESGTLVKQDQLRDAPFSDARATVRATAQSRAELIEARGTWIRIRTDAGEGWVRATSFKRDGVTGPAVASLAAASGRQAVTTPTASLGIRGVPPGTGATHALIMTISKYHSGIPELVGVKFDAAKATNIAKAMGVDPSHIQYLKDDQVTVEGVDRGLDQLYDRINPGDQVFIYYSGHGGRSIVLDPEPRCAESLVSVTGEPYVDSKLEEQLKRLSQKAGKIIAFIDACHSGGVTKRSVSSSKSQFRPKTWSKGDTQACVKPVNIITRGLNKTAIPGSGAGNYVYIAASRDNEIALDYASKGGLATSAWSECIAGAAIDRDGSGGLSAHEIQECAQRKINDAVIGIKDILPHHVTITGNANTVLAFAKQTPAPVAPSPILAPHADVALSQVAVNLPAASTTQTVGQVPAKPITAPIAAPNITSGPVPIGPAATLNDLFSNRDDRRKVEALLEKQRLQIGTDKLSLLVKSSHSGYIYVLMAGSDGKGFDLLFPNRLDQNNQITANMPITIPRANWEVTAMGPPGTDRLLVLVSDGPRDFSVLPLQSSGPFSVIETSPVNAKDIQLVFGGGKPATAECKDKPEKRNLAVAQRCSSAYGAALMDVEEVR